MAWTSHRICNFGAIVLLKDQGIDISTMAFPAFLFTHSASIVFNYQMLRRRNVLPFDFVEATSAHVSETVWGSDSVCFSYIVMLILTPIVDQEHGRVGIYIGNKWTTARAVPVPFKEERDDPLALAHPDLFCFETWIKEPGAPPNLYWTRVTKQCANYIVHYMVASTRPFSSGALATRIDYIGDILMLKVEGNSVVSVENTDIDEALEVLEQFI